MQHEARQGWVAGYTLWVMRRRWWVLGGALALSLAAGVGAKNLGLSTNYRVYFADDSPVMLAYDEVESTYTRNDNVLFVIKPPTGDVFNARTLELVRSLTEDAWQIPYSTRVDAITNYQHTWSVEDDLVVEDLLGDGEITPEAIDRVREVSLSEPLLDGRLISTDGSTTGINVRISLPGESSDELPETVAFVRALEAEYRELYPETEIHASGISMLNAAFAESPLRDMPVVMPLMFLALVLAMVGFLRSFAGTVATLTVISLSAVTAVGVAGHFGMFFDPTSSAAPVIILTLAVADSVHILVTYFFELRRGRSRKDALVEAMVTNAQPVFLTSLTTAIGFLTLNFSEAPPFQKLGNVTAFGVMVAWLFSFTVLPAILAALPIRVRNGRARMSERVSEVFGSFVSRRYREVLVGTGAMVVALSLSIRGLEINDQYFEYFDESLAFRQATDFTLDNLTGLYGATFSLESGETQGVTDPEYLAAVDDFTSWLRARPAVAHVASFTTTMKRLNKNMHGDDPAYYRLPEQRDLGAQYLLLYELSLPYGLDVNDQIDLDKSSLRLDVTYGDVDTAQIETEVAEAEAWLQEYGTPAMQSAEATGPSLMFAQITRSNLASMVWGTGLGFVLIAIILMLSLKSVRIGLISLVPNILPAAMAFGVWALLIGQVGFAVSVVAGLSIGIIVDDTVHFLTKYNRARRQLDAPEAVRHAFRSVGSAILGNTVIVATGFAMLGLSTFRVTAYMGLLTSLTVVSALVVDFLLLPALLIALDRRRMSGGDLQLQPVQAEIGRSTNMNRKARAFSRVALVAALAAGALSLTTTSLRAQSPEARGLEIALEADRRDLGWHDNASDMRMVLRNRNGKESVRELRRQAFEVTEEGLGDKSIIVFDAPRDIDGTALLSHTRTLEPDDQWLFLPALKRVKRISSANKSGPFVGSEFAFEDLVSQEVGKYDYRFLRQEACGDLRCYVVERYPLYENSGYTRQIVWWDDAEYRVQRIEFYDRKGDLLKTLDYSGYREYLGQYWRPDQMRMENHQNGKSTDLVFEAWEFGLGLDESLFTSSRLRRTS